MPDNLFPTRLVIGWLAGIPVIAYLILRALGIHYPSEPLDFFGVLLLNSIAVFGLLAAWLCTSAIGGFIVNSALNGQNFGAGPSFRIFGVTGGIFGGLGLLTAIYEKYASLVALRNYALQGKSNLDVEFRRRSTLIPQLTAVVQELREHTEALEPLLAALRGGMAGELRQTVEAYPELGTYENFRRLEAADRDPETPAHPRIERPDFLNALLPSDTKPLPHKNTKHQKVFEGSV